MKRKLLISLSIIGYFPLILYNFFRFIFLQKKILLKDFRADSAYCIEGTLNQLLWNVNNCIFIILDGSSKLYFNSDSYIFKVDSKKSNYRIKCYGWNEVIISEVQIKVVILNQKSFNLNLINPKNSYQILKDNDFNFKGNLDNSLKEINASGFKFQKPKIYLKSVSTTIVSEQELINELYKTEQIETINQIKKYNYD